jgi:hypothetical protein
MSSALTVAIRIVPPMQSEGELCVHAWSVVTMSAKLSYALVGSRLISYDPGPTGTVPGSLIEIPMRVLFGRPVVSQAIGLFAIPRTSAVDAKVGPEPAFELSGIAIA